MRTEEKRRRNLKIFKNNIKKRSEGKVVDKNH